MCTKKLDVKGKGKGKGKKGKGKAKESGVALQTTRDPNAPKQGTFNGAIYPPTFAAAPANSDVTYIGRPYKPNAALCPPLPVTCLEDMCPPKFVAAPANSDVAEIGRARENCPTVIVVTPSIAEVPKTGVPTSQSLRRRSRLRSPPDCPCLVPESNLPSQSTRGPPNRGWHTLPTVTNNSRTNDSVECRPTERRGDRCRQTPPCLALPCVGQCIGKERPKKVETKDFECQVTMEEPKNIIICANEPTCPGNNNPCGQFIPESEEETVLNYTPVAQIEPVCGSYQCSITESVSESPESEDSSERVICSAAIPLCVNSLPPCLRELTVDGDTLQTCDASHDVCGTIRAPCGDTLQTCDASHDVCGTIIAPCGDTLQTCDASHDVCGTIRAPCSDTLQTCDASHDVCGTIRAPCGPSEAGSDSSQGCGVPLQVCEGSYASEAIIMCQNPDPGSLCNSVATGYNSVTTCYNSVAIGTNRSSSCAENLASKQEIETESLDSGSSDMKCCPTEPTTEYDTSSSDKTQCCDATAIQIVDSLINRCGRLVQPSRTDEVEFDGEFNEDISKEPRFFHDFEKSKTTIPRSVNSRHSTSSQAFKSPMPSSSCQPCSRMGGATPSSLVSTAMAVVDPQSVCGQSTSTCVTTRMPVFSSGDVSFAAGKRGQCEATLTGTCRGPSFVRAAYGKKVAVKSSTPSHGSVRTPSIATTGDGVSLLSQVPCKPVQVKCPESYQKIPCAPKPLTRGVNKSVCTEGQLKKSICSDKATSNTCTNLLSGSQHTVKSEPSYGRILHGTEPICYREETNAISDPQRRLTCSSQQLLQTEPSYSRLVCPQKLQFAAPKYLPRSDSTDSNSSAANGRVVCGANQPQQSILQKKYVSCSGESSMSDSFTCTPTRKILCGSGHVPDTDSAHSAYSHKRVVCGLGYDSDTVPGKGNLSQSKLVGVTKPTHEKRPVCESQQTYEDVQRRKVCSSDCPGHKYQSQKINTCTSKPSHHRLMCSIPQPRDEEPSSKRIPCAKTDIGDTLGKGETLIQGAGGIRMRIVCAGDSSSRTTCEKASKEVDMRSHSSRVICGATRRSCADMPQTLFNSSGSNADTAPLPQRNSQSQHTVPDETVLEKGSYLTRKVVCVGGGSNAKQALCRQSTGSENASSASSPPISEPSTARPDVKKIACGRGRVQRVICGSSESSSPITGRTTVENSPPVQETCTQTNKIRKIVSENKDCQIESSGRKNYSHVCGYSSQSTDRDESQKSIEDENICKGKRFDKSKYVCKTYYIVSNKTEEKYKKVTSRNSEENIVNCRVDLEAKEKCENRGKEVAGCKGRVFRSQGTSTSSQVSAAMKEFGGRRDFDSAKDFQFKIPALCPGKLNIGDSAFKRIPEIPCYERIHDTKNVTLNITKNVCGRTGVCGEYIKTSSMSNIPGSSSEFSLSKERSKICSQVKSKCEDIKSQKPTCTRGINTKETEQFQCLFPRKRQISNESIHRKAKSNERIPDGQQAPERNNYGKRKSQDGIQGSSDDNREGDNRVKNSFKTTCGGRCGANDGSKCSEGWKGERRGPGISERRTNENISHQSMTLGASLPNVRILDLNNAQLGANPSDVGGKDAQHTAAGTELPGNRTTPQRKPGRGGTVIILDKPNISYPSFKNHIEQGRPTVSRTVKLGKLLDEISPGTTDELPVGIPPDLTVPKYSAMEITLISITATESGPGPSKNVKSSLPRNSKIETKMLRNQEQFHENQLTSNINQQTVTRHQQLSEKNDHPTNTSTSSRTVPSVQQLPQGNGHTTTASSSSRATQSYQQLPQDNDYSTNTSDSPDCPTAYIQPRHMNVCEAIRVGVALSGRTLRDMYLTGNKYSAYESTNLSKLAQNYNVPQSQHSMNVKGFNPVHAEQSNTLNGKSKSSSIKDTKNSSLNENVQNVLAASMKSNLTHQENERGDGDLNNSHENKSQTNKNSLFSRVQQNQNIYFATTQHSNKLEYNQNRRETYEEETDEFGGETDEAEPRKGERETQYMQCKPANSCWKVQSPEEEIIGPCPCVKKEQEKPKKEKEEDHFAKRLDYRRVIDKHYHSTKGVIYSGHFEPLYENIHEELKAIERDKQRAKERAGMLEEVVNKEVNSASPPPPSPEITGEGLSLEILGEDPSPKILGEILGTILGEGPSPEIQVSYPEMEAPPPTAEPEEQPNLSEKSHIMKKCSDRCPAETASECQASHIKGVRNGDISKPTDPNARKKHVCRSVSRISCRSTSQQNTNDVRKERSCKPSCSMSSSHKISSDRDPTLSKGGPTLSQYEPHHSSEETSVHSIIASMISKSIDYSADKARTLDPKSSHRSSGIENSSYLNKNESIAPHYLPSFRNKSLKSVSTPCYQCPRITNRKHTSSKQLCGKVSKVRLCKSASRKIVCIPSFKTICQPSKCIDSSQPQQLRFVQPQPPPPPIPPSSLQTCPNQEYLQNIQPKCEPPPGKMLASCAPGARPLREDGDRCGPSIGICVSPSGPPANSPPPLNFPPQSNEPLLSRDEWPQQENAADQKSFDTPSLHRRWEKMDSLIDDPIELQCMKWRQCKFLARHRYGPAPPGCLRGAPASCPQSEATKDEMYIRERLMSALWGTVDSGGALNLPPPQIPEDDEMSAVSNNNNNEEVGSTESDKENNPRGRKASKSIKKGSIANSRNASKSKNNLSIISGQNTRNSTNRRSTSPSQNAKNSNNKGKKSRG